MSSSEEKPEKTAFQEEHVGEKLKNPEDSPNLKYLLDVKLDITFEVGRARMLISDLMMVGQGSVVELHRLVGEDLDLFVNGQLVAKGEVVVVNERFGCRIKSVVSLEERIRYMGAV